MNDATKQQTLFAVRALFAHTIYTPADKILIDASVGYEPIQMDNQFIDFDNTAADLLTGHTTVVPSSYRETFDISEVESVIPVYHSPSGKLRPISTSINGDKTWVIPPDANTQINFKNIVGHTRSSVYCKIPISSIRTASENTPLDPDTGINEKRFLQAAEKARLIHILPDPYLTIPDVPPYAITTFSSTPAAPREGRFRLLTRSIGLNF